MLGAARQLIRERGYHYAPMGRGNAAAREFAQVVMAAEEAAGPESVR
jgi:elongation factor P hydroxylase